MTEEQAGRLLKALEAIKPILKDKTNPHFKSRYADINNILEDVKPILHANKLFILQPIADGQVMTQIIDAVSGEIITQSALPINMAATPQQKGSEITYYRRYTLQSLLGLEAEDDDGNMATHPPKQVAQPQKPVNPQAKSVNQPSKPLLTADIMAEMKKYIKDGKKDTVKSALTKYNATPDQLKELGL